MNELNQWAQKMGYKNYMSISSDISETIDFMITCSDEEFEEISQKVNQLLREKEKDNK